MSFKRISPQTDGQVINGIASPKWRSFQEALAEILKVTIAVVGANGSLLSMHNLMPPVSEFLDNPALREAYQEFFRKLPWHYRAAGTDHVLVDPLGLPVGAIPVGEGNFLVLGGCLDSNDPERLEELKKRLHGFGIYGDNLPLSKGILLPRNELRENLAKVEMLYSQMIYSINESNELGQQVLLLSCVEEVNKLMVATLNPESFNLQAILDLVASSLVIILDAKGAMAFTHRQPDHSVTVFRGEHFSLMEKLRDRWELMAAATENPGEMFPDIARDLINTGAEMSVEMDVYRGADSSAFIAVIEPQNMSSRPILSALGKQVVIALEVSLLYEVLHRRFGMLLNSIRHGIIVTNGAGNTALINKAAVNILRAVCINLMPGEPLDGCGICNRMEEAVGKVLETGCSIIQKRSTVGEGEDTVHLRWDAMPLTCEKGNLAGSVLIFDDITEPVNLFREIQDWERLATAGEVAAGLAHEIRNPLATAMAAIQLFELSDDQDKRRELMMKLSGELQRMNQILTSFLSLSKPALKDVQQQIDIVEIFNEMEYLLRSEAHLNEIDLLITHQRGTISPVTGSATDIKQVFLNIARNAVEAMTRGGRLEISVYEKSGWVTVSFKDNGTGIAHENLENITRPFFTTKLGGTGLGLSISSSIVKMMGGRLSIKSRPGKGTTVKIFLPAYLDSLD